MNHQKAENCCIINQAGQICSEDTLKSNLMKISGC